VKVEILVYDLLYDSEKIELEIKVEDTGLGIYPEDLKNLFKPFFKSSDSANLFMNQQGHGLGLNICSRLINAMGGTLTCESERGVGSIFTITL
jgi:signal transduction histidine kinase